MADVWDEISNLGDILGEKRNAMIRQSLSVETSKLYNAWQMKADNYLQDQELTSPTSYGFGKEQQTWYQNNLSEFSNNIRDKRVLANFQQLAASHEASFGTRAKSVEISKIKQNHLMTYSNTASLLTGQVYSAAPDQIDQVFEQEVLPQLKLLKENAIPELQDELKAEFQSVYQSYIGKKKDFLAESLANNLITDEQYKTQVEALRTQLNNNPDIIAGMDASAIKSLNENLSTDIQSGANKYKQRRKVELENDFKGEMERYYDGEPVDPIFKEEFLRAHANDPNYEVYKTKFDLVEEFSDFFQAKKMGDVQTMDDWVKIAQTKLDKADATGQEYEQLKDNLTELSAQYQKTLALVATNTAEAFKNNDDIKKERIDATYTGDYTRYVDEVVIQANKIGIDPSSVEFLDDKDLQGVIATLASAEADEVEGLALDLKSKYDIPIGKGSNAFNNIIGQIIAKSAADKMISPESAMSGTKADIASKAIALQYAGTPIFNDLILGSKLSLSEADVKYLGVINVDANKVRTKVAERLKPMINSIRAQTEDGEQTQNLANAYVDAVSKAALNSMLKGNGLFNTEDNNINHVVDQVQNKTFKFIDTGRVSVRIPRDIKGKDYSSLAPLLETKSFRETLITEAAKENGIAELSGDIGKIITNLPRDIESRIKSKQNKMTLQDLIDNSYLRTSPDNSGVYIYVDFGGKRLPLRFSNTGFVNKSFEEIDLNPSYKRLNSPSRLKFSSPYGQQFGGGE